MRTLVPLLALAALTPAHAQTVAIAGGPPAGTAAEQLEDDPYTRYELLDPRSGKFRILYEVSATDPGATSYFNPIRKGSRASDERVTDLATGKSLPFRIVDGRTAHALGLKDAELGGEYLQVTLARPVSPNGGEGRILIDKTYEDAKSYYTEDHLIVFDRSLGIDRNAIVLPVGYTLVSCNLPAQILQEADGRTKISFWDVSPAEAPLILKARPVQIQKNGTSSVEAERLEERANQTREIVYLLQQPETHSFELYHDYTEKRAGTSTYVNVVRAGSKVSNPSGMNLDTGQQIKSRVVYGADITRAAPETKGVMGNSEAVVFSFEPIPAGGSARLRFRETYTDRGSYRLVDDELIWERTLGRAANAVVLPAGWVVTNSSAPAIASVLLDGRLRLDNLNPRADELQVLITGRRGQPAK